VTPLLDKDQLAALLRRSPRTIDRWRAAGLVLDPLPGPGHPTWDPEEVAAWLKAGRPAAAVWRRLRPRRR
jgi:phage terminase Nu1 subunit (DNA packaging protein)